MTTFSDRGRYNQKYKPSKRTVTKVCEYCENEFEINYYDRNKVRFCSISCGQYARGNQKHPPVTKICEWCRDEFEVPYVRRKTRFCNKSCSRQFQSTIRAKSLVDRGIQTLEVDTHDYTNAHKKVNTERTKTFRCTICHKKRGTNWAYLGGNPYDVDNYVELCGRCHWRFDKRRVAVVGICK